MIRNQIIDQRTKLLTRLEQLDPAQWDTPSLCAGWTIRNVVAHITMPFRYSTPRFMIELVRSGVRFNAMADRVARRDGRQPVATLTAGLRDNLEHPWSPPGGGLPGALTHDLVHGLDITRPLGLPDDHDPNSLRVVLDNLVSPRSLRALGANPVDGIELQAQDLEWSHGSGTSLSATAADLVLLLAGRREAPSTPDHA